MRVSHEVLSIEEIKKIHNDSIRILEEVGVKVPSEKALSLLEKAGAKIDWDKQVALISEAMVTDALKKAPKEFTLGARNPEFDLTVPSHTTWINMDGCGTNTIDFFTGKKRNSLLKDLEMAGRIFDEIDSARVLWSSISPSDVTGGAKGLISSGTSMINCCKHLQDEVQRIEEVPYVIEMCKAILGSFEEVRKRKIYSATYCTVAPLCHDGEMLEATMELSSFDAPILIYPMPASGSTGPASLYSNIALGNAEELSAIVIFQLANPGCPLIYGSALGRVNIKSGIFLEGAVETQLMMSAMCQIGKYYGFPTIMAGCLSDANAPGMQSAMEKTFSTLPLVLNNVDVIQGIGLIESSMTLSFEHMLIDEEIFNQCLRMRQGIDVSDEKNYFEDIKAVAQGGHYLKQKSTRNAFRSDEFYRSSLISGDTYETWLNHGSKGMFEIAHEKVQSILDSERKYPMEKGTEKIIREIMEEAKAKL